MKEVPEEELAAVTAVAGVGGTPFLCIELATTTACILYLCKPCKQQVSKVADIPEKEASKVHAKYNYDNV